MNVPPPPGMTRSESKALNRRRLLDAARLELIERGYASLTAKAVSARAGVAQSSFYAHFADREALVRTLAEEIVEPLRQRLHEARAVARPGDWHGLWVATWAALYELYDAHRELLRLLFQELDQPDSPINALGLEIFDSLHNDFREDIGRLIEQQRLPAMPLEALTHIFVGTATYVLRRMLWQRVADPESLMQEFTQLGLAMSVWPSGPAQA